MARNNINEFELLIRQNISNNILDLIKKQGISQRELSRRSGVPAQTIAGYVKCKSTPNDERIEMLAKALHVETSAIDPRQRKITVGIPIEDANSNNELMKIYNQLDDDRKKYLEQVARDQLLLQKLSNRDV